MSRPVVFFDGDETLWDFEGVMRRSTQAVLDELASRCPEVPGLDEVSIETNVADRAVVAAANPDIIDLARVRHLAWERTLGRVGLHEHAAWATERYFKHRDASIDLYDDTVDALTALGEWATVGLLTNGNTRPERHGLGHLLVHQVYAEDIGVAKPDRRAYVAAARVAGVDRAFMVGDSLDNDVTAAQAAGWAGVWLDRTGSGDVGEHRPDAVVNSLHDVGDVVRTLGWGP